MARIRTIKPEFWDSPSTAKADLAVRLAYIAMWNWADDSGRGTANVKELEAFVFPNDEVTELPRMSRGNSGATPGRWRNFTEVLGEVAEAYGVRFYRVGGRPYYVIPQFKSHQSKDFRPKSKYPTEEEGEFYDVTSGNPVPQRGDDVAKAGPSADSRGDSAPIAGNSSPVIGEQGNRGTGEQGIKDLSDSHESNETTKPARHTYSPEFEDWWKRYPKRTGSKKNAYAQFKAALKRADLETLTDAVDRLSAFVEAGHRQPQYVKDAERWLKSDMWEEELVAPAPEVPKQRESASEMYHRLRGGPAGVPNVIDHQPPQITARGSNIPIPNFGA